MTVSSIVEIFFQQIIETFIVLVASLLSCLHQLKIENSRLEDNINVLVSRRDHLLAVNARLAIPLGQQTATTQGNICEADSKLFVLIPKSI